MLERGRSTTNKLELISHQVWGVISEYIYEDELRAVSVTNKRIRSRIEEAQRKINIYKPTGEEAQFLDKLESAKPYFTYKPCPKTCGINLYSEVKCMLLYSYISSLFFVGFLVVFFLYYF